MSYRVRIDNAASKKLRRIDKAALADVLSDIYALADNPRPHGCLLLKDSKHSGWRVHSGKYRVLYRIDDTALEVEVFDVDLRDRVYRRNRRRF